MQIKTCMVLKLNIAPNVEATHRYTELCPSMHQSCNLARPVNLNQGSVDSQGVYVNCEPSSGCT